MSSWHLVEARGVQKFEVLGDVLRVRHGLLRMSHLWEIILYIENYYLHRNLRCLVSFWMLWDHGWLSDNATAFFASFIFGFRV
jgi:hypothetical protein